MLANMPGSLNQFVLVAAPVAASGGRLMMITMCLATAK
jgi:hypothetical protein